MGELRKKLAGCLVQEICLAVLEMWSAPRITWVISMSRSSTTTPGDRSAAIRSQEDEVLDLRVLDGNGTENMIVVNGLAIRHAKAHRKGDAAACHGLGLIGLPCEAMPVIEPDAFRISLRVSAPGEVLRRAKHRKQRRDREDRGQTPDSARTAGLEERALVPIQAHQRRPCRMPSTISSEERARSVSSMRRMNLPP